jgi:hypothetical protein
VRINLARREIIGKRTHAGACAVTRVILQPQLRAVRSCKLSTARRGAGRTRTILFCKLAKRQNQATCRESNLSNMLLRLRRGLARMGGNPQIFRFISPTPESISEAERYSLRLDISRPYQCPPRQRLVGMKEVYLLLRFGKQDQCEIRPIIVSLSPSNEPGQTLQIPRK